MKIIALLILQLAYFGGFYISNFSLWGSEACSPRNDQISVVALNILYRKDGYRDDLLSDDNVDYIYDLARIKLLQPAKYKGEILLILIFDKDAEKVLSSEDRIVEFSLDEEFLNGKLTGSIHSVFLSDLRFKDIREVREGTGS